MLGRLMYARSLQLPIEYFPPTSIKIPTLADVQIEALELQAHDGRREND